MSGGIELGENLIAQAAALLEAARANGDIIATAESCTGGLVSAALIDGRIDSKEEKLLLDVARNLGISDADSRNMMNNMAKMVSR